MEVLKMLVLWALFVVSGVLCHDLKEEVESTVEVNTRGKRETEIDVHSRDKPKISNSRMPANLLIPAVKRLSPINIQRKNAIPRRLLTPIVTTPKIIDATEVIIKNSEAHNNDNDMMNSMMNKSNNGTTLDITETSSPAANSTTNTEDESNDNDNKNKKMKEEYAQNNSKSSENKKDEQRDDDNKAGQESVKQVENELEIEAAENNDSAKMVEKRIGDMKSNKVLTKLDETSASISVQKVLPEDLLASFKVVPSTPTKELPNTENELKIAGKVQVAATADLKTDKFVKHSIDLNNHTTTKEKSDEIAPKLIPLTILTDAGKIPIKMASQLTSTNVPFIPKLSPLSTNKSAVIPQTNTEDQVKISSKISGLELTSQKVPKPEPEEIVIQNNNYEELFEASPQQNIPKVITSELRFSSNLDNFNSKPPYNEENSLPQTLLPQTYAENKPYSYEIMKYPDQYVVNTFDDVNNNRRQYNDIGNKLNSDTITQTNNNKPKYINNKIPWTNDSNNQPKIQEFGDNSLLEICNQRQGYPKRIWRSWKNNQIFIRPRYGNSVNTELYKGLGQYLANANVDRTPVYTSYRTGANIYENENSTPYLNPLQYRRYGY